MPVKEPVAKKLQISGKPQKVYSPFAAKNEPEPVLRHPSIRAPLSTYLYGNSGHLKIKLFPKRQKNFREQWSAPKCEWTIELTSTTKTVRV